MHDIETLIRHFLGVSWGPVMPAGEAFVGIENSKGNNGYYLVSDGDIHSYRTRIRTPSFAHIQMLPLMTRGLLIPDLLAILGSIDFVLGRCGPVACGKRFRRSRLRRDKCDVTAAICRDVRSKTGPTRTGYSTFIIHTADHVLRHRNGT